MLISHIHQAKLPLSAFAFVGTYSLAMQYSISIFTTGHELALLENDGSVWALQWIQNLTFIITQPAGDILTLSKGIGI